MDNTRYITPSHVIQTSRVRFSHVIQFSFEGNIYKQDIRSMERVSAQCVAFRMLKQVVTYRGRNLQRCKQFPRCGRGPKILKVDHVTPSRPLCHGWVTWGWGKFRDSRGRDRCVEVDRTVGGLQRQRWRGERTVRTSASYVERTRRFIQRLIYVLFNKKVYTLFTLWFWHPFDLILHFLLRTPSDQSASQIWSF